MSVWTGVLYGGVLVFRGRIHNLFGGSHFPCHTILLLYRIHHFPLSCDTLQPASHNILMEPKYVWYSRGATCDCVDALGVHGRSNFPVCLYFSVLTSSICMTRGRVDGLILLSGYPGRIKSPVDPASAIAWLRSIFILDVLNKVS